MSENDKEGEDDAEKRVSLWLVDEVGGGRGIVAVGVGGTTDDDTVDSEVDTENDSDEDCDTEDRERESSD